MYKVVFIESLGDLNKIDFTRTNIPEPLSLEYFQAILERISVESSIYYGEIDEKELFQELLSGPIIAIGFSVYTYQYPYSLELSKKIKSVFRGLNKEAPIIIFGGYHPSALPDMVIQEESIDIVVKGEGEFAILDIIKCITQKGSMSSINGIWYKDNNGVPVKTNNRERNVDIDELPLPKRHSTFLSNSNQYQITYPPVSQQKSVTQVMYSRGCPFSCVYCASENMWGKQVVWRSPEKVLDEIEYLHNEYGTNMVFFPDLTFNLNKKKVMDICDEFIKRNVPVYWHAFFRLDRLDNEMLHAIKEAKCMKIHLGIETDSIDADRLKNDYFISKDDYYKNLNAANDIGLIIRGFLIIGFSSDTQEKIRNYNNFLSTIPVDEIGVSFITPFPGTQIWGEYHKKRLLTDYDFSDFTTKKPVINHPVLATHELYDLHVEIIQKFYLDSIYQKRILSKITKYPHLRNSYFEYFKFLEDSGIFNNNQLTNIFKKNGVGNT